MEIRIGITQPRFNSTFSEYQRWINGIPISSPVSIVQLQTTNSRSISFPSIHGIVFTGGADIHPSFYGVNSADPISERYRDWETDRKSTRLNSSHSAKSRMPSSA